MSISSATETSWRGGEDIMRRVCARYLDQPITSKEFGSTQIHQTQAWN
jgi:hypothetical protein